MTEFSPVLVTGMHRGGTSAISKVLEGLGLDAGSQEGLIGATDSNRHGHYEVREIVDLNEEILENLEGSWLSPPRDYERLVDLAEGSFGESAREIIGRHFTNTPWFIKDPRFCLLLPFWRKVLSSSPTLITVVRSADSIAQSLYRRNGIPVEFGRELTSTYLDSLIRGSEGLSNLVISYEEALRDPKNLAELLAQFLTDNGSVVPSDKSAVVAALDQTDNHHPDSKSNEEQVKWHGKALPTSFQAKSTSKDSLMLGSALASSIRSADHYKGVAEERETALFEVHEQLNFKLEELAASQRECIDLQIQRDKALFERERALAEVESIRAFREVEVASTTYQLVALVTRIGARLAPQSSKRRILISFCLKKARRAYSAMSKAGFIKKDSTHQKFRNNDNDKNLLPVHFEIEENDAEVTLIIPVHGKVAFTARCLHSIKESKNQTKFRVIVVDDASLDSTSDYLEACSGITVISNTDNKGYLISTNLGASSADTDFIILLNNDTEVSDGWLDALIQTFARYPDSGVVGASLVYPDGRLQEAGGIIFKDGSGWNYGRFQDPDDAGFAFVRQVDYCSAACIAVRKELWDEIGGFDERFAPAYYEDTDLAFMARQLGWKVRFQPRARIVHHEGISHGNDETSGLKAHQKTNREVFVNKWAIELQSQYSNSSESVLRASNRNTEGRIFVGDYEVPQWDRHSGALRMSRILGILVELGWQVTFAPGNNHFSEPYTSELRQQGIEVVGVSESVHTYLKDKGKDFFEVALLSRPEDGSRWLSAFRTHSPKTKIVYDTVDLHVIRMERGRLLGRNDLSIESEKRIADLERGLIKASDLTLVVSEVEKDWLSEEMPDAPVLVVGNVHSEELSAAKYEERDGLLFIGSWNHLPNRDAVEFLLQEIAPDLWKQFPDLLIHLVGSDIPSSIGADDKRIISHGWVEDISKLYDQVKLSVAPLRYGAGLKGKVGESLCRGVPVIGTSIAFEGFDLGADLEKIQSDSSTGLVKAITEVYQDENLWSELASSGRKKVLSMLGEDQTTKNLQFILENIRLDKGLDL